MNELPEVEPEIAPTDLQLYLKACLRESMARNPEAMIETVVQIQKQCDRLQRKLDSLCNAAACAVAEYPTDGTSPGMALLRAELKMLNP